jgi:tRNA (guanine26-N2/guanine27-N2)-dimethyltransferase
METTLREGTAVIYATKQDILSKKMPVFYNPVMKHNRDISILLLAALPDTGLRVCLPLAGSGVRGIRLLKELPASKIKSVHFNDKSETAVGSIRKNIALNKVRKTVVSSKDANLFLRESEGFDYIDIDPFGTPNPFLDASIQSLSRTGILAVTATDTAALCGTSPKACKRKYWAVPLHGPEMHELGLRILIRKVQLVAAQYSKALTPVYSYSKDHYMRVFFRNDKAKQRTDELLRHHGMYKGAGPLWLGRLWDPTLAVALAKQAPKVDHDLARLLKTIASECTIDSVGFYDIHSLCKKNKWTVPKNEDVLAKLKDAGLTHFSEHGIRTTEPEKTVLKSIKDSIR